jgi:4-hydroxy-tetrahydrodipicolinate synthase
MIVSSTFVPIVTPFKQKDLSVDYDSLSIYLDFLYKAGIRSLIVGGTTGESIAITNEERASIVNFIKSKYTDITLAGGVITADWHTLNEILDALSICDVLLVMPQVFIRPTIEDMRKFFEYIIQKTNQQIILYNNPARLGVNIAGLYKDLYQHPNVVGVKETLFDSNGNLPSIPWWCGEDLLAIDAMKANAAGLISTLSNLLPEIALRITTKIYNESDEIKWKCWSNVMQDYLNPIATKYLLYKMGLIASPCLRFALTAPNCNSLDALLEATKGIK